MQRSTFLSSQIVQFILYLFIGFLFFYKYGSRISDWLTLLFIPYGIIIYYYVFQLKGSIGSPQLSKWLLIFSNIALVAASVVAFSYIDVHDLQVDRWSVITHYWDAYFAGENPYSSTSHMGNYYGSYPFYFILNLPFYLVGEIGWAPIISLLIFQGFIHWKFQNFNLTFSAFVLSVASLCIPYEIVTRSTIFENSTFVLIALISLLHVWNSSDKWKLWAVAFCIGLLVCTRPIYGLVFLIAGIFLMRHHFFLVNNSICWGDFYYRFTITFFASIHLVSGINHGIQSRKFHDHAFRTDMVLPHIFGVRLIIRLGVQEKGRCDFRFWVVFISSCTYLCPALYHYQRMA